MTLDLGNSFVLLHLLKHRRQNFAAVQTASFAAAGRLPPSPCKSCICLWLCFAFQANGLVMADLSTLRAAKQALDEQLITQQDFDCVKVAFLRAQQIKAGLDAGFIKQEAYERASGAYLHALDFQLMSSMPSLSAAPASNPAPGPSATPALPAQPVSRSQSVAHTPAVVPAPAAAAPQPPAAPAPAAVPRASSGPIRPIRNSNSSNGSLGAAAGLLGGAANGDTQPNSPLSLQGSDEAGPDIPADLPDYCKGASRGKVGLLRSGSSAGGSAFKAGGGSGTLCYRCIVHSMLPACMGGWQGRLGPCRSGQSVVSFLNPQFTGAYRALHQRCCSCMLSVCLLVLGVSAALLASPWVCPQKSMSGIELDETCVNLFMHMKTRSSVSSTGDKKVCKATMCAWLLAPGSAGAQRMPHLVATRISASAAEWYRGRHQSLCVGAA